MVEAKTEEDAYMDLAPEHTDALIDYELSLSNWHVIEVPEPVVKE